MHAAVVDTHMGKERLSLRVDPETKGAINEYAEERDVSKSEAGRRMIRAGLSQNGYQIAEADGMGTGQLEELRHELSEMEQRQAARANQRERLDVVQAVSVGAVLAYLIFTVGLGASGPLWTVVGIMSLVSYAAAHLWAFKLGGGDDE
jgi:hypothetical protein